MLYDLPVELFLDNILPLLPVSDLFHLASTSRFFYLLVSDDTFWHRKIQADFNFSGSDTARTTGWKFLYKRLSNPKLYVWGERSHGRLGLDNPPRTVVRDGVPYPVQLNIPGVRIVNIVAGGMSFNALDSHGDIYVWGVLDGTTPRQVPQPQLRAPAHDVPRCRRRRVDAHVVGPTFPPELPLLDKATPESTPVQVESGWMFSAVLTTAGDVLVFWPFTGHMKELLERTNEELNQTADTQANIAARARPTDAEPRVIPCHWWVMQGVDPLMLPPIPTGSLPELKDTGLTDEQLDEETKLVKIAGMDNNLIGLTNKGHVLIYGMLGGEDSYQRGRWEYLPYFSEVEKVKTNDVFSQGEDPAIAPLEPPQTMHITHISASYQTFIAYSTGPQSVVLMGRFSTDHDTPPASDTFEPAIIPALQRQSVISVVLGDYHYGALTASGKLLNGAHSPRARSGSVTPACSTPGSRRVRPRRRARHGARARWGMRKRERYCFAAGGRVDMGALVIDLEPDDDTEEPSDTEAVGMPGAFRRPQ
ncbi:hypothetical protein A0H81_06153 [Grifola frondosa]|uniref:F-box domain-containing protein n=1 Tax=Grifola frondosa TaxID=5627 RepID=A0A1C7M977_GRIFR|nr:hypothetical protein A0H81_06153 [Grifola frondosa]